MASMNGAQFDVDGVSRSLRAGLLNRQLSDICRAESLATNGVKAELQARITARAAEYRAKGDIAAFNKLKRTINEVRFPQANRPAPNIPSPYAGQPNYSQHAYGLAPVQLQYGLPALNVTFKESPFFKFQGQLGSTKPCDTMAQHRHTVEILLRPQDHPLMLQVVDDKSLKIMVYCSGECGPQKQDVAFPHQSEIKVNGGDIKANLRGLKNKPGSTRPVDITNAIRYKPLHYENRVSMTYALTVKKFYLSVWVVKATPVEALVKKLELDGLRLSKESVLREMAVKASDPDIEAMSSVLSLKCPLSTLRIDLPCRSTRCRHLQCFDATSYLQLQEQGPTWLCPICNNPAPYDTLAVDGYVKDILNGTSRSVDQVTIDPLGVWSVADKSEPASKGRSSMNFGADSDDDLVEIVDDRLQALKNGGNSSTPQPATPTLSTPGSGSFHREPSTSSSIRRPSSKRPAAEIVDLISDDDEEPVRPAKKQQTEPPQTLSGYGQHPLFGVGSSNGTSPALWPQPGVP